MKNNTKAETVATVERERERATLYSTWNSFTQPSTFTKKRDTSYWARNIIYLIINQNLLTKQIGFVCSKKENIEERKMIGHDVLTEVIEKQPIIL